MPGLGALWDSLVDCICRPPRDEYIYPEELVGGSRRLFRVGRYPGIREDLTLTNKRGLVLQCSHYLPKHVRGKDGRLPCVIYCHCNSGSRRDAEEAVCVLIPCGVSVFTLDFAGSGLSEGQWVTLGAEEVDDVATAVEHLRAGGRVSTLGLWGRSMGAVTALLYSHRDPSIAGMVLDSPFSRLTDLMLEIVQEQRLPIPRPLAKLALAAMKRSVMKRAGFDITKVSPVDFVSQSHIPALFGHATGDTFIRISHAEALHEAYAGEKELLRFEGDHNSRRPEFFYTSVSTFWHRALLLEHLLEPADLSLFNLGPATLAGASGGTSGSRGSVGRPLRPPPPRLRQPQSNPALTAAASVGTAAVGAIGGGVATTTTTTTATTTTASAATADGAVVAGAEQTPVPQAQLIARDSAASAAAGGEEDEGADVAGASSRSAPWEPRLWELDADKAARERQRFRRMAGGLPSPSLAADVPPGGQGGGGGSSFHTSAELAKLFATASDESLAARLLGDDPQWSDGLVLEQEPRAAGMAAQLRAANGTVAKSLTAASPLLLPTSEEEEEAQLRAALQLSLLEAGSVPPPRFPAVSTPLDAFPAAWETSTVTSTAAAAAAAVPIPPIQRQESRCRVAGSQLPPGEASGCKTGSRSDTAGGSGLQGSGLASGVSGASMAQTSIAAAAATPPLPIPIPDAVSAGASSSPPPAAAEPSLPCFPSTAVVAARAQWEAPTFTQPRATGSLEVAEALINGRSNSQASARAQLPLETLPSAALSGPPHPEPQALDGSAPPAMLSVATAAVRPQESKVQQALTAIAAPALAANMAAGSAYSSTLAGVSAVMETPGLSMYDLYTEDELMALAVQLSLQESTHATAVGTVVNAGGSVSDTGGTGTGRMPSLI